MFSTSTERRALDAKVLIVVWKLWLSRSCAILLLLKLSRVVYDSNLLMILAKSALVARSARASSICSAAVVVAFCRSSTLILPRSFSTFNCEASRSYILAKTYLICLVMSCSAVLRSSSLAICTLNLLNASRVQNRRSICCMRLFGNSCLLIKSARWFSTKLGFRFSKARFL